MNKEIIQQRFDELKTQYDKLPFIRDEYQNYARAGAWQKWATSALHLIKVVFTENSPHYQQFVPVFEKASHYAGEKSLLALRGIFDSAKEDFEGGYVFNLESRVSGEVLGNFVVMAKEALNGGHKNVAAVLACAALEDTLKRFAGANGLNVTDKPMNEVINALKSQGLVSGPQKSLLDSFPKIRIAALHAEWDNITEAAVGGVIGFVEHFLLSKFDNR